MIGIIDYQMGNLRSVQKAFEAIGIPSRILTQPKEISEMERLVLPGVGAFADGMGFLDRLGFITPIHAFIESGKPFLGICIGMEVLFEGSEEDALSPDKQVPGLGILRGSVVRFQCDRSPVRLKVPHMGWNTLRWDRADPLLSEIDQDAAVYFVHSYYAKPAENDRSVQSATCDYGGPFCASVWKDNIWATQFHPEKSQKIGLKILSNFASAT